MSFWLLLNFPHRLLGLASRSACEERACHAGNVARTYVRGRDDAPNIFAVFYYAFRPRSIIRDVTCVTSRTRPPPFSACNIEKWVWPGDEATQCARSPISACNEYFTCSRRPRNVAAPNWTTKLNVAAARFRGNTVLYMWRCLFGMDVIIITRNELASLTHSFCTCLKHQLVHQLYSSALP